MKVLTNEETMRLLCHTKAESMWQEMTDNEKVGIRFGLFPAQKMMAADKEGYDGRLLAVALMQQAEANGGMKA